MLLMYSGLRHSGQHGSGGGLPGEAAVGVTGSVLVGLRAAPQLGDTGGLTVFPSWHLF